jgi:type II secretory pathway component GspD/PulD (secretin)
MLKTRFLQRRKTLHPCEKCFVFRMIAWRDILFAAVLISLSLTAKAALPSFEQAPRFLEHDTDNIEAKSYTLDVLVKKFLENAGYKAEINRNVTGQITGTVIPANKDSLSWFTAMKSGGDLWFFLDDAKAEIKTVHVAKKTAPTSSWIDISEKNSGLLKALLEKAAHGVSEPGNADAEYVKWEWVQVAEGKGYLLVVGHPRFVQLAQQWAPSVSKLDLPPPPKATMEIKRIHLEHAHVDTQVINSGGTSTYTVVGVFDTIREILGQSSGASSLASQIGSVQIVNNTAITQPAKEVSPVGSAGQTTKDAILQLVQQSSVQNLRSLAEGLGISRSTRIEDIPAKLPLFNVDNLSASVKDTGGGLDAGSQPDSNSAQESRFSNDVAAPDENQIVNQSQWARQNPLLSPVDFSQYHAPELISLSAGEIGTVTGEKISTTVHKDSRTNSIILIAPAKGDHFAFFEKLIRQLDVPQPLVEISAAIVDVNSEVSFEWNSNLAFSANSRVGDTDGFFGGGFNVPANSFESVLKSQKPGLTAGLVEDSQVNGFNTGLSMAGLLVGESYRLLGRFRALETEGKAQIISRPTVLTLDNTESRLSDTTVFSVPVSGFEDARLYQVTAEITIRVIPHVVLPKKQDGTYDWNSPAQVKMVVHIADGVPTESQTDSQIPVINTSTISTQATVRDGQSLLIGGRYRHEETKGQGHVPFFGKIPILGLPFKGKAVDHRKLQRMFMITPKIVNPNTYYGEGEAHIKRMVDGDFDPSPSTEVSSMNKGDGMTNKDLQMSPLESNTAKKRSLFHRLFKK